MLGMPVISVAQAGALASAGNLDGKFAAVGGYWMQYALPCPFMPHQAVVNGYCSGGQFADTPQAAQNPSGIGPGSAPIAAPETLHGDLLWSSGGTGPSPFPVVLIVHAGDSRSWQCRVEDRDVCQRQMIIDDVAWVNGSATEPSLPGGDISPKLSLADIEGMVAKSEQLVTAYPLHATQLNDVDPRFLGQSSGVVWYLRVVKTPSGSDGLNDGVVRLVSDDSSAVTDELPLVVSSNYAPARLILDADPGTLDSQNSYVQYSITMGAVMLSKGQLGMATAPLALEAGTYGLHAFLADSNGQPVAGPKCDLPITVGAATNVAYLATFSGSKCDWAAEQSQF